MHYLLPWRGAGCGKGGTRGVQAVVGARGKGRACHRVVAAESCLFSRVIQKIRLFQVRLITLIGSGGFKAGCVCVCVCVCV